MKKIFILLLLQTLMLPVYGNFPIILEQTLNWSSDPIQYNTDETHVLKALYFEDAQYNELHPTIPFFSRQFPIDQNGSIQITVLEATYEPLTNVPEGIAEHLASEIQFLTSTSITRNNFLANLSFVPLRRLNSGQIEKLVSFKLKVDFLPGSAVSLRGPEGTDQSVLADGDIFKIAIANSGIHKLTFSELEDAGIPLQSIDPRTIKIYGNGGGPLPEPNDAFRYDDLAENPIFIQGENDGSFDSGDFILFYAEGADKWNFDEGQKQFFLDKNPYDNYNFYFLKINPGNGARVSTLPNQTSGPDDITVTSFHDFIQLEEDNINLLYSYSSTQGSGQEWFGDNFRVIREQTYDDFNFPNLITSSPIFISARFAGRSEGTTRFYVRSGGQEINRSIGTVNPGNALGTYAKQGVASGTFPATSDNVSVTISYPEQSFASEGWLDYILVNAERSLSMVGNELQFRNKDAINQNITRYRIANASNQLVVWDISDPVNPAVQQGQLEGNTYVFATEAQSLKQYVAFNQNAPLNSPKSISKIENQNIHGIDNVDLVILYHPSTQSAAERLADHRSNFSDLNVALVPIDLLYNEFSSGRQDPAAIRDFARFLLGKTDRFKYLLLFGDASFDFRNNLGLSEAERHHLVPTYQTRNSFDPIESFPTDDFFALLSPGEGDNLKGALDIAVGRLPVKNASEANMMVDKIINYDSNPEKMRDWRNRIAMVADDEDNDIHFGGADRIAKMIEQENPTFNILKIYLDAYKQVSTPGGTRFPDANVAINQNMFKGLLVMNYLGHGGSTGWAQERVLTNSDINSWTNEDSPTLLVTATCSFTGFDEPNYETGGELAILNEKGGAIGLFTTTRAVYAFSNERLTTSAFEFLFKKIDNEYQPIGEVLRLAKNSNSEDTLLTNARKFAVVGDPSMYLAIPSYDVITTNVNGKAVGSAEADTLKALDKVTIEGFIADENGNILNDFNGIVYPTIYDKRDTLQTLGQDAKSKVRSFTLQKNILFKGAASVNNGQFSFTFVVPKDIDYQFGYGKISYYAQDGSRDATGYNEEIIIGGTSETAFTDDQGPTVEVFMNSESFVFGGITNEDPILLVKLFDDNGINIVGASIGHDLTATLDDQQANAYILNDFYEAELDDYRRGMVRFPLFDIEEGRHRMTVKAWDVANNSSTGFTEFVVASSQEVALEQVLNYPNPFTTNTYFEFKHNRSQGEVMDVQIRIFTISGKLVKTIRRQVVSNGDRVSRNDRIQWDGKDDYGDNLARGVYLYKVKVGVNDLSNNQVDAESEFEKLVILK